MRRLLVLVVLALGVFAQAAEAQLLFGEKKYPYALGDVLANAAEFVEKEGYWEAYAAGHKGGDPLGYVFLTDNLVEIPGYSGHTLNTLVGLDPTGKLTGVKIVSHAEPIVLIGLSEQVILDFVAQYPGRDIRDRIIISNTPKSGYVTVDGISGATVTAVAENATIFKAARQVAKAVGIVKPSEVRVRRPSSVFAPLDWPALVARAAIGRLTLQPEDVHGAGDGPALELYYAILDSPSIGQNLLGEAYYKIVQERLARDGGSALFIGGRGAISFKGAGFARGGVFDRFSLEQGGDLVVFQDVDYVNHFDLPIEGGVEFHEGGIFYTKNPDFDPAQPFTFHLTLPYRVGDKKEYAAFVSDYVLPADFVEEEIPFWKARWQEVRLEAAALGCLLIVAGLLFTFRNRLLPYRKVLHHGVAVVAVVWIGLLMKAQPSTTQILTPVNAAVHGKFPFEVFLSEPLIFLFWIAILVSLPVWGRGFFCGWLCPYGALLELLASAWHKVAPGALVRRIDRWEPGPVWRWGKYATFLVILAVAFASLPAAEMLDEVEPFKTFILRLARPAQFVAYFAVVTVASMVVYRAFCRFLCPLGGALALASFKPLDGLKRYEHCTTCKICFKGCEPKAISSATGRIDYRECLHCWDCQATGEDTARCPEQITAAKEGRPVRLMFHALILGLALAATPSAARTWPVVPVGQTLAEALAAAADGDTVEVAAGVYHGNFVVARRITLHGEVGAILDAGGSGHVLAVNAPGVVVEGLTLRASGRDLERSDAGIWLAQAAADVRLLHNRVEQSLFGIWVHGSPRAAVIGNQIEGGEAARMGDRGNGIHLWNVEGAVVQGNTVVKCRDGIYMELSHHCRVENNTIERSRYAIHTMWCDGSVYKQNRASDNFVGLALMFSKGIEARGNTLYNNRTHGILLIQDTRSQITDNRLISNTKGLFVYNSLYNTIGNNLIAKNYLGMHYWGGSEDNELHDNTFVDNEIQVKFVATRDQRWDSNYWSDYLGWDVNRDGRGDTPYLSNTMVDTLLWQYPAAKLLLTSPAFQLLAAAERAFPVIAVPKGQDATPWMVPPIADWQAVLAHYPAVTQRYYGQLSKLPHIPGGE